MPTLHTLVIVLALGASVATQQQQHKEPATAAADAAAVDWRSRLVPGVWTGGDLADRTAHVKKVRNTDGH